MRITPFVYCFKVKEKPTTKKWVQSDVLIKMSLLSQKEFYV